MILTVSPTGELTLPAELVPAKPNTQVQAERQGNSLHVRPAFSGELSAKDSPSFWEEFPTFPAGPVDPAITFRREDLYDDFELRGQSGNNE